ncbi:lymphatic vessel endothelial hyaluronic receptor 1b isoform X2 [Sphaeramia orbicularis]|nr:lymphatic vessel endothelial hyaluronic acid receptor 1-like isoform X2 [Sphaeramia orbicularis]
MVTEGGQYGFNFTEAIATCQYLNVTIATKAQIEQALAHGLETCKFGWIAEQIAVVPRMAAVKTCGNDKTGVVPWNAEPQKKFGVYCFNASNLEETKSSTSVPQTATSSSSIFIHLTQKSTTPIKPVLRSTTEAQSATIATTERTRFFSAFTSTIQTTRTTTTSFSSRSPNTLSTSMLTLPPRVITSLPADVSLTLTAHTFDSSVSSAPASSVSSARPRLGALSIVLIVLCIIVLILTAGGAASYYKWSFFSSWPQGQQKDDVETEMWKQTGSEMDLHIQHEQEEEEEEADRKYGSDATLCMNPDLKSKC